MDRDHFMRNLWRWKSGVPEDAGIQPDPDLINKLRETEWSPEFETLMRNRLVFGAIRYGRMGHGSVPHGKPLWDRITSIRKRLDFFEVSGNAEYLVDIANLALLMYEERRHPNFHFDSIDDGYHDKIIGK